MPIHQSQVLFGMIKMVVIHDESLRLEAMAIFESPPPRMSVAPITFARRIVNVFGTQRRSQFPLAMIPTLAQNPAGSTATAARIVA